MTPRPGSLLISTASMDDPAFEKVVIMITEINSDGATGFIINQVFERRFNELVEFRHSRAVSLFTGGPVEKEKLYFIHRRPDLIRDGNIIAGNFFLGGDFNETVRLVNNNTLHEHEIRLFVGYSGWDATQLEDEINEGSWLVRGTAPEEIFNADAGLLWDQLITQI